MIPLKYHSIFIKSRGIFKLLKQVGKVLKRYRKEAGFKRQDQLAKKIGGAIHHGFISRVETGRAAASLDYIEKWLSACKKDEKQFFHDVLDQYFFPESD